MLRSSIPIRAARRVIIARMSGLRGRRLGIAALLVLLAVAPVLALAPAAPGAVRIAGVSILWWYTALIAPLVTTAITIALLVRDPH
jgi:hypothetical protein